MIERSFLSVSAHDMTLHGFAGLWLCACILLYGQPTLCNTSQPIIEDSRAVVSQGIVALWFAFHKDIFACSRLKWCCPMLYFSWSIYKSYLESPYTEFNLSLIPVLVTLIVCLQKQQNVFFSHHWVGNSPLSLLYQKCQH